jgi:hypothetical protein
MRCLGSLSISLIFSGLAFGQAFDAASIRRSPPYEPGMANGMHVDATHFITEQYHCDHERIQYRVVDAEGCAGLDSIGRVQHYGNDAGGDFE